jgi:antitoxin (DNA-binding transcriptional repressor) of toxin-antitoxin stability system
MKLATISFTKNNLSALLDQVRQGETILVMDRDRPIARIEPVTASGEPDDDGRVGRLERGGVIRRGTGGPVSELLTEPPAKPAKGRDVLDALLAERKRSP